MKIRLGFVSNSSSSSFCVSCGDDCWGDCGCEEDYETAMAEQLYVVIGGYPMSMPNGTVTFTSIRKLGQFTNMADAEKCRDKHYDDCGGLINIFEIRTREYES